MPKRRSKISWKKIGLCFLILVSFAAYWLADNQKFRYFSKIFFFKSFYSAPGGVPRDGQEFFSYLNGFSREMSFDKKEKVLSFKKNYLAAKKQGKFDKAGILAYHQGNFEDAITLLQDYHRQNDETEESLFWLGLSYLRLGEAKNCLDMLMADGSGHHAEHHDHHMLMCILPLMNFHKEKSYGLKAAEIFTQLLDSYDNENIRYRWLLNFSYMVVGKFPEAVPPHYLAKGKLIDYFYGEPTEKLKEKYSHIILTDQAKELGVNTLDPGKGVAIEDFDQDGDLDIITGGFFAPTHSYVNQNGEGFVDNSETSGLASIKGAHIITAADYDNDGAVDLLISHPTGTHPNGGFSLMRNKGNGTFENTTFSSGLLDQETLDSHVIFPWAPAWADIDNDGDLDLFIAMSGGYSTNPIDLPLLHSRLYRNDGETFTNVTKEFGLEPYVKYSNIHGAAFGDYNNDGFADLAFTGLRPGLKLLYRNKGGKKFEQTSLISSEYEDSFMISFLDVNHDGLLDVFHNSMQLFAPIARDNLFEERPEVSVGHSAVFIQTPDGTFRRQVLNHEHPTASMGTNFGDLNNDGAYEFYLGTGDPEPWFIMPNLMLMGTLDETTSHNSFKTTDISPLLGLGNIQKGHGIVFFDFDNDGDQDLYSSLGGMWPSDAWPNQLFVNNSITDNSWIKIRLNGTTSNFYGLGANIKIEAETEEGNVITRHYLMDNKTGFGSAPYIAHIGLKDSIKIRQIEVLWPGQSIAQKYQGHINQMHVLKQNSNIIQ